MIKITIYRDSNGSAIGFKTNGHAGFAEYGRDIVCAAVSVLTINFVNSVEKLTGDRFKIQTGDGLMKFRFQNEPGAGSKLLMDSLILGLQGIQNDYKNEYIQIIFKEV